MNRIHESMFNKGIYAVGVSQDFEWKPFPKEHYKEPFFEYIAITFSPLELPKLKGILRDGILRIETQLTAPLINYKTEKWYL